MWVKLCASMKERELAAERCVSVCVVCVCVNGGARIVRNRPDKSMINNSENDVNLTV